jgi:sugar phosphate isomerase/epimerase
MLENPIGISYEVGDLQSGKAPDDVSLLNIVNPMLPGYLDTDYAEDIRFLRTLEGKSFIVDGPFIDLSPGTPEPAIREVTYRKVTDAIDYSVQIGAEEILFLSTYQPFVGLRSYTEDWLDKSSAFWRKVIRETDSDLTVSICNTFEFDPANLLELTALVDQPRFCLAIDVGHILVWSRVGIGDWCTQVTPHLRTICLHSNDGDLDLHASIRSGELPDDPDFPKLLETLRANPELRVLLKYTDNTPAPADREYLRQL